MATETGGTGRPDSMSDEEREQYKHDVKETPKLTQKVIASVGEESYLNMVQSFFGGNKDQKDKE